MRLHLQCRGRPSCPSILLRTETGIWRGVQPVFDMLHATGRVMTFMALVVAMCGAIGSVEI